jgi:hypothetical protein
MKYDYDSAQALTNRLTLAVRQTIERVMSGQDIQGSERAHVICVCPDCASAVGKREKEIKEAVKQTLDTMAAAKPIHPSILDALTRLQAEVDGMWTPDARKHIRRLKTLLGMHGAPFVAEELDHSPDGLVSATPLKKIATEPAVEEMYYILDHRSGGHCVWWMPNTQGYTYFIHEAGKYTRQQCARMLSCSGSIPYKCSEVDANGEGNGRGRVEVRNLPCPTEIQRKAFWSKEGK